MSRDRVIAALGIYGSCGILAWTATAAVGRSPWHLDHGLAGTRWASVLLAAGIGTALGGAAVALSRTLVRRLRWARELHTHLRRGLLGLSPRAVAPLALASAVGEELFFRGGIQAAVVGQLGVVAGVALTAVGFGLAHVPSNRQLIAWTAMAGVMGVVFGALYQWTGELAAPIAAHAVINHANLRFILRHEAATAGARGALGSLVPRRAIAGLVVRERPSATGRRRSP